jgi:L-alanine-DL-glutamate epimerase-like enolase superfamily enzyme
VHVRAVSIAAVVEEMGSTLVDKDPFRIEEHWQAPYHIHHNVRGGILQISAISGIEIARYQWESLWPACTSSLVVQYA